MVVIAGIVGGLVAATLATALAVLLVGTQLPWIGPAAFFAFWITGIAVALRSPSALVAWRRLITASATVCTAFVAASLTLPTWAGFDQALALVALLLAGLFTLVALAMRRRGTAAPSL